MGEFSRRGGLSAPCRQTEGFNDTFPRNIWHGILSPRGGTTKFQLLGAMMMFFVVMVVTKINMERKRGDGIIKAMKTETEARPCLVFC